MLPRRGGVGIGPLAVEGHANGCPLDLGALLKAEVLEFLEDMARIRGGINRETGTLSPATELRFTLEARNADRG